MPFIIRLRSRRLEEVGEKENACEKETRASPLRAPVLSFAHYFQAPATQAIHNWCAGATYSRTSLYVRTPLYYGQFLSPDKILIYFLLKKLYNTDSL